MRKVVHVAPLPRVCVGDKVIAGMTTYFGPTTYRERHGNVEQWVDKPGVRRKVLNGIVESTADGHVKHAEGLWEVLEKGKSRFVYDRLPNGDPWRHKVRLVLKKVL